MGFLAVLEMKMCGLAFVCGYTANERFFLMAMCYFEQSKLRDVGVFVAPRITRGNYFVGFGD